MVLTEKELKKNTNRIAIVTTPYRVVLKPNERKNIPTHTDRELKHPTTTTLIHETDDASIQTLLMSPLEFYSWTKK